MTNTTKFQHFPFHLVSESLWPILTAFSVFNLAIGTVLYMHGFAYGGYVLTIGFILTASSMCLLCVLGTHVGWLNYQIPGIS